MTRYTTPALPLLIEGVDISADDIYVSFKQELPCGTVSIEKTNADLEISTETHGQDTDTKIIVLFTQEETAKFAPNRSVLVKVNYIDSSGIRDCTETVAIDIEDNLLDRVIEYGN